MPSVKIVQSWEFQCLGYKGEGGHVAILRRKLLNYERLKRAQCQLYISISGWKRSQSADVPTIISQNTTKLLIWLTLTMVFFAIGLFANS